MVQDMDDLAKAENINLKLDIEATDLFELAQTVADNMQPVAQNRNISVLVTGERTITNVDKAKLQQVFTNLLSNAVKYSNNGSVVNKCP